jgi:probable phosphoglycerate mutase
MPIAVLVTHSATAMALTNALLGIPQEVHPLGPLANCHWTELYLEDSEVHPSSWRLRGHNLGPPGPVLPVPVRLADVEASDADA